MTVSEHFPTSYPESRRNFLEAAKVRRASVETFVHPSVRSPSDEEIATDIAVLGRDTNERLLMIVSGTHGVEGYAGAGCQMQLLQSDLLLEIAESTRLVLVHAINPYGFAYDRRVTEDNIDLNRNFIDFDAALPLNPNYLEQARNFLLASERLADYQDSEARLDAAARAKGGYQFFKTAMQPGQYADPAGLYFGGAGPCWSNRLFMQLCQRYLAPASRVAVLDIHTGLGPCGVGELMFMREDAAQKYSDSFSPPVSCAGRRASLAPGLTGTLVDAACHQARGDMALCCVLEFGTVPIEDNVKALMFDNWAHRHLTPRDSLYLQGTERLKKVYYHETASWKRNIIDRFIEVTGQLHRHLLGG